MSCLATTFCTVSTILVGSSRREAMSSLAMSCPVKSQHSRCSLSAATVVMTWCGGAPRKTQKQQHKHHDNGTTAHNGNMFLSPFQDSTQHLSETVHRRFTTNSNTAIGRGWSKFHTSSNLPVRVPRSCHCPRRRKRKATRGSVWQQLLKWCSYPARRNAMSCLAMSCALERHHGRNSKGPPQS